MKYLLFLFFPLFLFSHTFSVASYNVYNLFDSYYDGSEYSSFTPKHWSHKEYLQKKQRIAKVLQDLDADIVALQEIENKNVLQDLLKHLPRYKYFAITTKKEAAISVALISKYPIIKTSAIEVQGASRNILQTVVDIKGYPLALYTNHWRSLNAKESHRIAYAKALMEHLQDSTYKEYILLGDFNSNYNRYLYTQAPVAINHTLGTIRGQSLVYLHDLLPGFHTNLWLQKPLKQRMSYRYRGRNNTLDAFIIPYTMIDSKGIDYVNNSFSVFKPSYLYDNTINRNYSDHLPIKASFSTDPFKSDPLPRYKEVAIQDLYTKDTLTSPKIIDATVTYKDRYGATIKDASAAIYIFMPNITLTVGKRYRLLVNKLGSYHSLQQIRKFEIFEESGSATDLYLDATGKDLNDKRYVSQVIASISGRYNNNRFYYSDKMMPIYFQDKEKKPQNGTKIRLKNVRISIYKNSVQLLVSDTTKVEKI